MKDNKSHRSITRLHLTSVTGDYRSRQLPSGSGMAYNVRECLLCLYMTTNIGELTIAYIVYLFVSLSGNAGGNVQLRKAFTKY